MFYKIFIILTLTYETPSEPSSSSSDNNINNSFNLCTHVLKVHYRAIFLELRHTVLLCRAFTALCRQRLLGVQNKCVNEGDSESLKNLLLKKKAIQEIIYIHESNYMKLYKLRNHFYKTKRILNFLKGRKLREARKPLESIVGCDNFHKMLITIKNLSCLFSMKRVDEKHLHLIDDDFGAAYRELYAKYDKDYKLIMEYNIKTTTEWEYFDKWFEGDLMEEALFYIG